MRTRESTELDALIGAHVRRKRLARGLSQQYLARQLGLSFQQLQKYENGTNRISASRLFAIAMALRADIAEFYDLPEAPRGVEEKSLDHLRDFVATPEGVQLVAGYLGIKNRRLQVCFLRLLMIRSH